MQERALANEKIEFLWNAVVTEVKGDGRGVVGVDLLNNQTEERSHLPVTGYFSAIGHKPNTDLFKGILDMDDVGYLKIDAPSTRTSVDGVFAAGMLRIQPIGKQLLPWFRLLGDRC